APTGRCFDWAPAGAPRRDRPERARGRRQELSERPPIVHVVGARPNFMKAGPVVHALAARGATQLLVHTGQHYDRALSEVFFEELGLPEPDRNLEVGSGSQGRQTAALVTALEDTLPALEPAIVVVYGDVNSTLATALVTSKQGLRLAHVERS